ncbi:MAG: hypothetical protein MUO21_02060 [Nitrososphaeraceae archaeon]|nr:hypothetical protein [Nitrososphaeraceae archaeon]
MGNISRNFKKIAVTKPSNPDLNKKAKGRFLSNDEGKNSKAMKVEKTSNRYKMKNVTNEDFSQVSKWNGSIAIMKVRSL